MMLICVVASCVHTFVLMYTLLIRAARGYRLSRPPRAWRGRGFRLSRSVARVWRARPTRTGQGLGARESAKRKPG